jgi:hypothetical protein
VTIILEGEKKRILGYYVFQVIQRSIEIDGISPKKHKKELDH